MVTIPSGGRVEPLVPAEPEQECFCSVIAGRPQFQCEACAAKEDAEEAEDEC